MRRGRLAWWGWAGAAVMAAGYLLVTSTEWWLVHTYFTPWMWTGYLLVADALLAGHTGRSWLHPLPGRFAVLLPVSLFGWLLFEAYNLHLRNWAYIGLPESRILTLIGYVWSFSTIWPALFLTADLLEAAGLRVIGRPILQGPRTRRVWLAAGILLAGVPAVLPSHLAAYTFVVVWIAWVPLLEPLLAVSEGVPSLLRDLTRGERTRWWSLGISGVLCGLLWESWNMLATARWVYIFPIFQEFRLFEMPAPGFLGFIPFAWEAWSIYGAAMLLIARLLRRRPDGVLAPPAPLRPLVPGS